MACDVVPAQAEIVAVVGIGSHVYENTGHVRTGKANSSTFQLFNLNSQPQEAGFSPSDVRIHRTG
jgi:hypothetical protein